jgi:hypothetical protein
MLGFECNLLTVKAFMEEYTSTLMVIGYRELGRIFRSKNISTIQYKEELHSLCSPPNIIRIIKPRNIEEYKVGQECSMHDGLKKCIQGMSK